jgi:protein gp37
MAKLLSHGHGQAAAPSRFAAELTGRLSLAICTFRDATFVQRSFLSCEPLLGPLDGLCLDGIGWVIAGGESGPNYRPMDLDWARGLRDACQEAGVPFFFKQWGGRTPKALGHELDGAFLDEMPLRPRREPG